MNFAKEIRAYRDAAIAQGWRIRPLASGHEMWLHPDGVGKVTMPKTPSGFKKSIADLRRNGLKVQA